MRIPESTIADVRSASDIVEIISATVALKKRGKNYLGRCPFHQEKTPSFNVSPEKQMYHCFGCGAGGNVFTFVMELEKVSFVEAVRTLADRAGINLPDSGRISSEETTEQEALYSACRMAANYFTENISSTVEGKLAWEYFRHRGFSEETIRQFGLGYSMHSWDGLIKKGVAEGVEISILEKAGLVIRREDGSGVYDRFRGRAMFPILATSGRTVGFGARKMREDDPLGKYINSPETPIYNKSRLLYGLFQAREAIREKEYALIVEGYADLISVFQTGIRNIVATSGTALTEDQIALLGNYCKNIVLVYDADSAGSKATLRGVDVIIDHGLDVRIAELPAGEDPDSFVKKEGKEAMQSLIEGAISFLDFKARFFQQEGSLETPEGQTRAVRSIVGTIARMKDELKRNFFLKHVAEKYGIYESVLYRELERQLGDASRRVSHAPSNIEPANRFSRSVVPEIRALPAVERDIVKLILEHGAEMLDYILSRIDRDSLTHAQVRSVVNLVADRLERGMDWEIQPLLDEIEDGSLREFIAGIVFQRYDISAGWGELGSFSDEADPTDIADRCIAILQRREIDRLLSENQRAMKDAVARGENVAQYLEHHQTLLKSKLDIEAAMRRVS